MKFIKVRDVKTPTRAEDSAGIDFYIPTKNSLSDTNFTSDSILIEPGKSVLVPSGIKVKIPKHTALIAFNKSGVCTKKDLICGACVVDESYTGEIHIHLINIGNENQSINYGEKVIQFILTPYLGEQIEEITEIEFNEQHIDSKRGIGGFGSTGIN